MKYFYIENEKSVWKSKRKKTDEWTASEGLENVGEGTEKIKYFDSKCLDS